MLRSVVQGARWYQHVARSSPSISPLSIARAFSVLAPRSIDSGDPITKLRFYEQNTPGSKTRRRVDPEAEDRADKEDVERELAQLDHELEVLKEGPFGANSPFIKGLPEKDREIALEALRKQEAEEGEEQPQISLDDVFDEELDEMLKEEFEGLAKEEENWYTQMKKYRPSKAMRRENYRVKLRELDLRPEHRTYVNKFNGHLNAFARGDASEGRRQDLWKWYRRCRHLIPQFIDSLPESAMSMLWSSQVNELSPETRAARLQILMEDTLSSGRSLTTSSTLSYIECLQELGKTKDALEQWEAHRAGLGQQKDDVEAYWRAGVQLFAAEDDPQRAQDIALAFLTNDKSRQPRILIPVLTAWGRQDGKEAEVKAWALYLQLKALLKNEMTMDDYDQISIGFLKAGKLDLAIAVFKDMMVTGQDPANDSTALYQAALGLVGNLQASSVSEQEVNKISLSTLTVLPRRFQNRFFYASWMKKLIGMGDVDSAAMVIELMYERGVNPDPKHLNGITAGWLRVGSASAREKAERLGWAMIQQRINRVSTETKSDATPPELLKDQEDTADPSRIPRWMQRPMPPANIETFSILLNHYTRRGEELMTEHLIKSLGEARLQPNAYIMNHLLYAELRKHDIGALWNKFLGMSTTVQPDLETWACLWDCGKLQYDRFRDPRSDEFPSPRGLYAEMVQWYSNLSERAKATACEEFSRDLYNQIIRCFCLDLDLYGTIVALSSLRAIFDCAPDDATARLITLQIARLAPTPSDTPGRLKRRLSTRPRSKENIANIQRLIAILSDQKASRIAERGLSLETLDPQEKKTYQLEIMTDLLRIMINQKESNASKAKHLDTRITMVAKEMGVRYINLGPPLEKDYLSPLYYDTYGARPHRGT